MMPTDLSRLRPRRPSLRRRAGIALAVLVALGVLGLVVPHLTGAKTGLPAVGAVIPVSQRPPAPDIYGTTLTGQHLNIASLRGAPVVINFWGSWCAPCQAEAPDLARAAASTSRQGVHFVGIDILDNSAAGLAFDQAHHITFPSISDPGNLLAARFGSRAPDTTPSTYILDARGRIAWAFFGRTQASQLELALIRIAG